MAEQVLIPEKRGGIAGLMNMFSQGAGMLQMGAKGKEGFASLMGSSGGGGGAGGLAGGGAGAYSLGVGNVAPVTTGMSPTLGGGAAPGGAAASGGTTAAAGEGIAGYAPYAAPVVAGYYEGKAMQDPQKYPSGRTRAKGGLTNVGRQLADKVGISKMPTMSSIGKGLSLTDSGGNKMSALERRYENTKNASAAIDEAHAALKEVQLPDAERRSIYQKLELAKRGGK